VCHGHNQRSVTATDHHVMNRNGVFNMDNLVKGSIAL
jgi:hypothetical protein